VESVAWGATRGAPGRDAVLHQAARALGRGAAVVFEGPLGIGKTATWRALVDHLGAQGWRVLCATPTEAEAQLPFLALADLLRPLAGGLAALPAPQRVAAEAVLTADSAEVVDERAIVVATRALLEAAAAEAPGRLLVAIDDVAWLDSSSARVLQLALRRLTPSPAVLLTVRTDPSAGAAALPAPLGLDTAPTRGPVTTITLGPLGVGALHQIIRARLGWTISRPLLARIAREAGGNPLMAIELARAVLRRPHPPSPTEDLPVVTSLSALLDDSVARLPVATREAVRLAALLAVPTPAELVAAGVDLESLDAAEEAGLLTVTPTAVTFAHPFYATAVRQSIPVGQRRRLHRTLADAVRDPDERALQLARCTVGPDPEVAAELAQAAQRLRARGAPDAAAALLDQAAALAPPEHAERDRWRLRALRYRFDSGDYVAASAAATALADELTGEPRVEALLLSAMLRWVVDDLAGAVAVAEQALTEAPAGSALAGRLHAHLSVFHDTPAEARRHAQAAIGLLTADDPEDRDQLIGAYLQLFFNDLRVGDPPRVELLDRALALEGGEPSRLAGTVPAVWWKGIDDHDRARDRLMQMYARAHAAGDEPLQHEVLTHLGETELLAGRYDAAAAHVAAARALGEQLGSGLVGETWLAAMLDAHRGALEPAQQVAREGLRRAEEQDDPWCRRIHLQLGGFVALSAGRMGDAAAAYGQLVAAQAESGLVESIALRFEPDWIEACVGAGDLDTAHAALARLSERHARLARPWTTLGLARSRVLLASATGADPSSDLAELAQARERVPAGVLPLERARCLLIAGLAHRRARRKREAQLAFEAAAAEFEAIGALAFAARARAELRRVGVRTARTVELSPTEQRVAKLAATGQTNRAIADELFISPKTVEANLSRIYRKLGVANRAQLGAALSARR
jgi:DNA-binding CsgD family transcriptional regulator